MSNPSESQEVLQEIMRRNEAITFKRIAWESAKEEARDAKSAYDDAVEDLNQYIRGLKELPLFDREA